MKQWNIVTPNRDTVDALCFKYQLPKFFASILYSRNLANDSILSSFLYPDPNDLHDPFLMKDMDRAVDRIKKAILKNESIMIYGDYDVDGATSTALLYRYLKQQGVRVDYYIPDRITEGYGLHDKSVRSIAERGFTLLITVDTGVTAFEEIKLANSLGLDCIVTDHHECAGNLPPAIAVVDPKRPDCQYPFKKLAGVGVVFKLICALSPKLEKFDLLQKYADLTAIGTISDVMPLIDENRIIVKTGLSLLPTSSLGVYTLLSQAEAKCLEKMSSFDVSFILAPRMNAAGRIGDASLAVELLLEDDPSRLSDIAKTLCDLNNERQKMEGATLSQALDIIDKKDILSKKSAIVLWHPEWHHGVVGIVASRIKDRFCRPTILFSMDEENAKGSGRTPPPLNLYETLSALSDYTVHFGGHALAAGVTVKRENLSLFADKFYSITKEFCEKKPYENILFIDAEISEEELTIQNVQAISSLEPFGSGNEVPVLFYRNAVIESVKSISDGKHIHMVFRCGRKKITAFYFGMILSRFPFFVGDKVDVAFQADINEFRGTKSVQMIVKDIHLNQIDFQKTNASYKRYLTKEKSPYDLIDRRDVVAIYQFLKRKQTEDVHHFSLFNLPHMIKSTQHRTLTVMQIVHAIKTLISLHILDGSICGDDVTIDNINSEVKVNLEDSTYFRDIQKREGGC